MLGRIMDMSESDAFISFEDGTTMNISTTKLPKDSKLGGSVDIPLNNYSSAEPTTSNKAIDFFI